MNKWFYPITLAKIKKFFQLLSTSYINFCLVFLKASFAMISLKFLLWTNFLDNSIILLFSSILKYISFKFMVHAMTFLVLKDLQESP